MIIIIGKIENNLTYKIKCGRFKQNTFNALFMQILVQFGKGNIVDLLIFSADLTSYLHISSDLLVSRESSRAGQEGAGLAGQWRGQGATQISINTKSRSQQTMQTINRYSPPHLPSRLTNQLGKIYFNITLQPFNLLSNTNHKTGLYSLRHLKPSS